MRNVEIKAICRDLAAARQVAAGLGAGYQGIIRQVDTYFRVPAGRFKLRQATPGPDQLVYYHRPDDPQPKVSDYQVVEVVGSDALCALLAEALGVSIQVAKDRELWLLDNVRIHLDSVEGLGTFIEFEVMVTEGRTDATARGSYREVPETTDERADASTDDSCHAQMADLLAAFDLTGDDLVPGSYADLLAGAAALPGPSERPR